MNELKPGQARLRIRGYILEFRLGTSGKIERHYAGSLYRAKKWCRARGLRIVERYWGPLDLPKT